MFVSCHSTDSNPIPPDPKTFFFNFGKKIKIDNKDLKKCIQCTIFVKYAPYIMSTFSSFDRDFGLQKKKFNTYLPLKKLWACDRKQKTFFLPKAKKRCVFKGSFSDF